MDKESLQRTQLRWQKHFRIIPSKYPPINFFENLIDSDMMDEVYFIESLTNDRLRDEVGDISLVKKEDRISGAGSSYVMAAFTHPMSSRFSDGTFGIYYASKDMETAIKETVYHTENFLRFTQEPSGAHTKRVLQGKRFLNKLIDIRDKKYQALHHANDLMTSRDFGADLKLQNESGILYHSVRHEGGLNVAILRPNIIELPVVQTRHLEYLWNGKKITHYLELGEAVPL